MSRERIEELLFALKDEVEQAIGEGEIGPTMVFRFYVPLSEDKDDVVLCEFTTQSVSRFRNGEQCTLRMTL
jgi:hypothetical protein